MSFPRGLRAGSVTTLFIASTLGVLVLGGCASSNVTPEASPPAVALETPPSAEPADDGGFAVPDASWQCGYVSALTGMLSRTISLRDSGSLDDASYEARLAAIQESWALFPPGESAITPLVAEATAAASEGLVSNSKFDASVARITIACSDAGSLVAEMQLPGQGG